MFDFFARRRREKLAATPFPPAWAEILDTCVPLVARLPAADRRELEGHIQVFLAEKNIEGAGGLAITDTIRVTIAAQACILLLHRDAAAWPGLHTIIVYPRGWVAPGRHVEGGLVVEADHGHLGESWRHGPVVLSWADARTGAAEPGDGHNVVLHEFAHQLDTQDGPADGAPTLRSRGMYAEWARVLGAEYAALVDAVHRDRPTDLDPYGTTNPAEFFAVVTEAFFERPRRLRARHPELYTQLASFYQQDPAEWPPAPADD
jgi:hypothetical protein